MGKAEKGESALVKLEAFRGRLAKYRGVSELIADVMEATTSLDILEGLKQASPWAEALGNALGDALPPVRFLLKLATELSTAGDDANKLGYLAATLAYHRAFEQAWLAMPAETSAKLKKVADPQLRKKALADLRAATTSEVYDFSTFTYEGAQQTPFFRDAEKYLQLSTAGLGFSEAEFLDLQRMVRAHFVANLKIILTDKSTSERFAPFRALISLDSREARAYAALHQHAVHQCWLFEEQPALKSEPFTLAQVYIETDCGVLRWEECTTQAERPEGGRNAVDPFNEQFGGRHPLVETVLELIADSKFKDAIVIQGVAGSGKSSATLRLAWELVRQGLRPIRIELKHLDSRDSVPIDEALPLAVRMNDADSKSNTGAVVFGKDLFLDGAIFNESVAFRGTEICPYVLILDGWDEISIGAAAGFQQRMARMLEAIRVQFFRNRKFPVRVLLAGRPSHAVEQSRFLLSDTRLLTVRSLSPDQLAAYVAKVKAAAQVQPDGKGWSLAKVVALPKVVERYRSAFEEAAGAGEPESGSLEVLGLPLLAHLALRLLAARPADAEELLENTTSLYRNLVDLVVGQAAKPPEAAEAIAESAMLKGAELRQLLRGTAEAMTTFGAEAIPFGELAVRLGLEDHELDQRAVAAGDEPLSRLMISFFFKGGRKELGVEFSHKSFREYLFAEQVVAVLEDYGRKVSAPLPERELFWRDFNEADPRRDFCHRLAELLGPVWVTPEVALHLHFLLAGKIASAGQDALAAWCRIRDFLADAWDWWGEGVHLRPQPTRKSGNWLFEGKALVVEIIENKRTRSDFRECPVPVRTTSIDAHLGDGLFLLTSTVHAELQFRGGRQRDESAIAFRQSVESVEYVRCYQRRLVRKAGDLLAFVPTGPDRTFFYNYCARINAGGYRPFGPFPAEAYLRGAYLRGVYLNGAYLSGADLRGADLSGADLRGADLRGADLSGADLSGADLRGAFLSWAFLSGADLSGAYLSGADLSQADLHGADLSRADVTPEQLKVAIRDWETPTEGDPS